MLLAHDRILAGQFELARNPHRLAAAVLEQFDMAFGAHRDQTPWHMPKHMPYGHQFQGRMLAAAKSDQPARATSRLAATMPQARPASTAATSARPARSARFRSEKDTSELQSLMRTSH